MAFDFRGDLDYMDWFKSFPLQPIVVVLGQIITPVLMMSIVHFIVFAVAEIILQRQFYWLVVGMCFSPLFNLIMFSLDNFLFLLFPVRIGAGTPGDLQHIGRMMVELTAKVLLLGACCGFSAAVGAFGHWITGGYWTVTLIFAWLALLSCVFVVLPSTAWAFSRFDVSIDTPT
jgi:hypothetical protein